MAFEIMLEATDAWKFFKENPERLQEELVEIGANRNTNTSVYLTDEDDYPCVVVERNDKEVFRESCVSEPDTEETVKQAFFKWLPDPNPVIFRTHAKCTFNADDPAELEIFREIAEDRETELQLGFESFLDMLTAGSDAPGVFQYSDVYEQEEDMLNDVLQLLSDKYSVSIYRPMVVFDEEEQKEVCTEYPYDDYNFGDGELQAGT